MARPRETTAYDLNTQVVGKGVKVLSRCIDPDYAIVQFTNCGHIKEITIKSLIKNKPFCNECYEKNLEELLNSLGFYLLSKQGNTNCSEKARYSQRLVSCKKCGYWKFVLPNSVRNGSVRCINCEKISIESITPKEFKLLNKIDKSYLELVHKQCSTTFRVQTSNLKRSYPVCPKCNKRNEGSFVYFIQITKDGFEPILKIGKSNNPYLRVTDLSDMTLKIKFISSLKFKSETEAFQFESKLHKLFEKFNLEPEIGKIYIKSGFTECYPVEIFDEIRREFEKTTLYTI